MVDEAVCDDCSVCLNRCQFGAISNEKRVYRVDKQKSTGCGLCVTTCPPGAIKLVRKSKEEMVYIPYNNQGWGKERVKNRRISMKDIVWGFSS